MIGESGSRRGTVNGLVLRHCHVGQLIQIRLPAKSIRARTDCKLARRINVISTRSARHRQESTSDFVSGEPFGVPFSGVHQALAHTKQRVLLVCH